MLVQTPHKAGDIITIKTVTGQEVIARYEGDDGTSILVNKPLVTMLTKEGMVMAPLLYTVNMDSTVKLNNQQLLCVVKSANEVADDYRQRTSDISI